MRARRGTAAPARPLTPGRRLANIGVQYLAEEERAAAQAESAAAAEARLDLVAEAAEADFSARARPMPPANYKKRYTARSKLAAGVARFSPDGTRAGVGAADASVLLYDVERMREFEEGSAAGEPLLQQYRLHKAPVTDMAFHPFDSFVASASRDKSVVVFNYRLAQDSRQFHDTKRTIAEVSAVRTLAWHPTGDAMLVGTDHPMVRLYDMPTLKSYTARRHGDHHHDVINHVEWAPGASVYATCSKDGSIKIWDGVSSECINTIGQAHTGASVSSVQFSKSGRYLLSVGRDSHARLVRSARQMDPGTVY